ncbi:unnamed protein product [Effrenium voratum]|uniref:Ubiquitin-like protease family profile domain-containing protein n=1 Tax=Effrenium voratum TaxID=2562239 RepID=A0AA36JJX7_9DINO|nr:unnamed protein product [Effrenium voratum]
MALISWKTARITASGLQRLEPGQWLDDEVMGFWIEYLATAPPPQGLGRPEVHIMDPAAANWILSEEDAEDLADGLAPLELGSKELVLVPVADRQDRGKDGVYGSHWALLALQRNGEEIRSCYYDSMGGGGNLRQAERIAAKLRPAMASHPGEAPAPAPAQENACDCGVFTLLFAEALARHGDPAKVTQREASEARMRMKKQILALKAGSP